MVYQIKLKVITYNSQREREREGGGGGGGGGQRKHGAQHGATERLRREELTHTYNQLS